MVRHRRPASNQCAMLSWAQQVVCASAGHVHRLMSFRRRSLCLVCRQKKAPVLVDVKEQSAVTFVDEQATASVRVADSLFVFSHCSAEKGYACGIFSGWKANLRACNRERQKLYSRIRNPRTCSGALIFHVFLLCSHLRLVAGEVSR